MIDKIGIALWKYRFQLGKDPCHWYTGTMSRDMLRVDRLGDEQGPEGSSGRTGARSVAKSSCDVQWVCPRGWRLWVLIVAWLTPLFQSLGCRAPGQETVPSASKGGLRAHRFLSSRRHPLLWDDVCRTLREAAPGLQTGEAAKLWRRGVSQASLRAILS